MSEKPDKLATDQEFRTVLNTAIATAMRWKRTSGYNEARNAGLRGFSQELAKTLMEEMVDEEGTPLWTPAEAVMVLLGTCALVAYGDIFPEKQRSLLGALKRESTINGGE
jgi:hypothetical protein